ncbi:DUF1345 domain-containing protein [Microbacteriaceae bacterium K1510]|nr:DUF1345 domain-containing protein [Microbacteriaceae bacterium K1510]
MATETRQPLRTMPVQIVRLHRKLAIACIVGVAVALLLTPIHMRLVTQLLIGWNAGIAVDLFLAFRMMRRTDVAHIRRRAAEVDEGAFVILLLSIGATLASLVAIVFELGVTKHAEGLEAVLHVLLATATILLSWTFMQTIFSFHYAHEYYGERGDGRIGGLNFPHDDQFPRSDQPDYLDFLYFALVVGMTSQVSDVAITSKVIRRMAAVHGVLSFFFNLTVLALTVNMVSNII